ncbi:ABC transporter permease [Mangrovimicrobium sediminis]|uniref:ABC transporter permease n=1 Tax=Mangrovimicrobium sediminis TaxID=2562682 RepID=A0A4Z0M5A1_9GAMM|nr:ABC transporter permease [Haliea sp. SAOS-164]TGD74616.1 ABC transporter permease [Haliea sp. SAOS-164]
MRIERRAAPSRRMQVLSPLLALVATGLTGAAIFAGLGQPPAAVMYAFFIAPVRDLYGISELLLKATPLLLCAVGLSLCFRARVWNIGAEGQFILGALGGGVVALACNEFSAGFGWALLGASVAGMLAGTAWAGIVALLRDRFDCSEILTSIMLNYIALQLLLWAVHGPLKDPAGFNFPESALLVEELLLPTLHPDYRVHIGLPIALLAAAGLWLLMARSLLGFQVRVFGESARTAGYAGFSSRVLLWFVLAACGALAGLAGAFEVLGPVGQVTPHLSAGYGFSAIIVVFLGRNHPVGIVLAGLLFALTFIGGENLQIEFGLPRSITQMFQGMLLFYLLAADFLINHRLRLPGAAPALAGER